MSEHFRVVRSCRESRARTGELTTSHGTISTPVFLPTASQGSVKALTPDDVAMTGTSIILANTYHLYLRPGVDVIEKLGGLHKFIAWAGPILTDSGGFQVFSLSGLRKISDEGVLFRSHIDGSEHFLTPESIIEFQERLGVDIIMPLDECVGYTREAPAVRRAMERTHFWATRSLKHHKGEQFQYGIVQGGVFPELRRDSARFITSLDFAGYALGGFSVGETKDLTWEVVELTSDLLPKDKPRYLMGVGSPEDIVTGVGFGIDIFDCVLPTRVARNGALFTKNGRKNIRNAVYKTREDAFAEDCDCYTCRTFSAAYLHHLFKCEELLAYRLATIHNLRFMVRLLVDIKRAINEGTYLCFKENFLSGYVTTDETIRIKQKEKWLKGKKAVSQAE